mmetsp:Transcript_20937/g.41794  ORF Transcript_20937/g.41794 Transcript_20937/m.41794 type:complete len:111 (-) Transcript_20937:98-430(-)
MFPVRLFHFPSFALTFFLLLSCPRCPLQFPPWRQFLRMLAQTRRTEKKEREKTAPTSTRFPREQIAMKKKWFQSGKTTTSQMKTAEWEGWEIERQLSGLVSGKGRDYRSL